MAAKATAKRVKKNNVQVAAKAAKSRKTKAAAKRAKNAKAAAKTAKSRKAKAAAKRAKNAKAAARSAKNSAAKVLRSEMVYEGSVFGVRRDEVIEPSGIHATREVVTHSGSVVVLPVLPDGRIVMIRQYRHATRQFLWELVAGRMDEGETPREAAARELIEETGYRARKFQIFLDVFPTPGFLEERMYILLAEGVTPGTAEPEEDEKITVKAFTHKELLSMIRRGKLHDAKSVAGILYYLQFLA